MLLVVELVEVEVSFPPPIGMTIVVPGRGMEMVIPPPPSLVELEVEDEELDRELELLEVVESVVGVGEGELDVLVLVGVDVGEVELIGTVRVISAPPGRVSTVVVKPLGSAVEVRVVGLAVGCARESGSLGQRESLGEARGRAKSIYAGRGRIIRGSCRADDGSADTWCRPGGL